MGRLDAEGHPLRRAAAETKQGSYRMFTVEQRSFWVEPCSTLHEAMLQGEDCLSHSDSGLASSTSLPASGNVASVTTVTKIAHPASLW